MSVLLALRTATKRGVREHVEAIRQLLVGNQGLKMKEEQKAVRA